jgi:hypothetical protein
VTDLSGFFFGTPDLIRTVSVLSLLLLLVLVLVLPPLLFLRSV